MGNLALIDDVESISFVDDANYKLIDGSFEAQIPQRKEVRIDSLSGGTTRDLLSLSYGNRIVVFDFMIVATTDLNLHTRISTLARMLMRASSDIYLSGGGYDADMSTTEGNNTGDSGLILEYQMMTASIAITNEDGDADTDTGIVYYRVVSGDMKINNQLESSRQNADGNYIAMGSITLECEPFALGPARIIATVSGNGLYSFPVSPDNSQANRIFIDAADVPGDAPALSRIYTQLQVSLSTIIARDAGVSLLNSTTAPTHTGSGISDMYCYGQQRTNSNKKFKVKISATGSPDSFQWSDDNGSSWETAASIVAKTPIQLGAYEVYIYFWNSTGHTLNDVWAFYDTQSRIEGVAAVGIYSNRAIYYNDGGGQIGQVRFTIPRGCTSRYRVYADLLIDPAVWDIRMGISFVGYNGTTYTSTTPMNYNWIRGSGWGTVDLGMLDLSPKVLPFLMHPGAMAMGNINVYLRSIAEIASGDEAQLTNVFLVPAQDEYSYLHAAWDYDGAGREVYCNYDPNNPYIGEVAGNHVDNVDGTTISGLDYSNAGNVITLIPGIDNTLLFLPMYSIGSVDWRTSTFSANSHTNAISVAIRPRYLYGG